MSSVELATLKVPFHLDAQRRILVVFLVFPRHFVKFHGSSGTLVSSVQNLLAVFRLAVHRKFRRSIRLQVR